MTKLNINFEIANFFINKSSRTIIKTINKNIHFLNYFKNQNIHNIKINYKPSIFKYQLKYFSKEENHKLDPYLILEVNRGADFKTIKAAYFKLARLYHPDTNKNDEVK